MEWPLVQLESVVSRLTNGFVGPTRTIYRDEGIPYLLARQVKDNVLKFDGRTYVSDEFNIKNKKSMLKRGDVLLVQSGHIGHSAVVPVEHEGHNCHAMIVITPKPELLGKFLSLYFNFLLLTGDILKIRTGSTVPHLTCGLVKELLIPLPALEEQKRIVTILDHVFSDIEQARAKTEQNLKNARELFESYLQEVFSQSGDGWKEAQLGDLFDIGSSKRIHEADWASSGVPFFGGKEIVKLAKYGTVVSNAYISEEKYMDYASKYDMPQEGDILMTARGTIGVGYIVKKGEKFYYKDGNIISLRQKTPTNPQFVLYAFRSKQIVDQIDGLTGTTVNHLPLNKAKEIVLNVPNHRTQNLIVSRIKEFESNIQNLSRIYERKLHSIDELKKSILQQAFTGQLTNKNNPEVVA